MLKIRLQRVGRKNVPVFRVVLTDHKNSAKSGKFLEVLGSYDPVHNKKEIKVERVKHWLSVGARPSETVHNFLIDRKLIEGKKINVLPKKRPIKKEEEAKSESVTSEAQSVPAESKPETESSSAETKSEEKSAESAGASTTAEEVKDKEPDAKAEEKPREEKKEEVPAQA
ncbi:MAG: 30S ribosomal protein S16 [bacterium]|nr:30S ribosomal protein S16 [bacterium]